MGFEFDLPEPTARDMAMGARCAKRIEELEERLRAFRALATPETDEAGMEEWRLDGSMLLSELAFWRAKAGPFSAGLHRGEAEGFWLVPRQPSAKAIRIAHGMTDLADISAFPRSFEATASELSLAVRLAIEVDGVPLGQPEDMRSAIDDLNIDARIGERKEMLLELDSLRSEFVKLGARYLEMRQSVEQLASRGNVDASAIAGREAELDKYVSVQALEGPLAGSIDKWRELFVKRTV